MIGVVLAAHGEVAPALLKAAEAIVGPLEAVRAITVQAGNDPACMRAEVRAAVADVQQGDGVLVLCDMFGGTPSNVCLSAECGTAIEVVTGVNLPMLVKLATARAADVSLQDVAAQIALYGQRHIQHATELMRERARKSCPAAAQPASIPPHAAGHAR